MIGAMLLGAVAAWSEVPGASILTVTVDGTIESWLPTEGADGRKGAVLVVRPTAGNELRLFRLSLDRSAAGVVPLDAPPLPADGVLLAARTGASRETVLYASRPGSLDRLEGGPSPRWTPWIEDPALRLARNVQFETTDDGATLVRAAGPGSQYAWRVTASGIARLGEAALPVEVTRGDDALVIRSPAPRSLGGRYVTPPEAVGNERIRVYSAAATPWPPTFETCWGRLPGAERVLDREIVTLDGVPHAIVATIDAGKLELFGEKRLRLFALEPDRTRTGVGPRLTAESGMNLWQSGRYLARDLDGDGREDLAVVYWKGLRKSKAAIEVFLADGTGGFGPLRRTEVGTDESEPGWIGFDRDLESDGIADLLLVAGGRLKAFRGRRTQDGRRIVEPAPFLDVPVGPPGEGGGFSISVGTGGVAGGAFGGNAAVAVDDLDGDGRAEIVVRSAASVVVVVTRRLP